MKQEKLKKLPLGMSSYSNIIQEDYYYVDKTRYIEVLESLNTKYPILLRPRRFGKTLFANMLQTYYDVKQKDKFDELFRDTYIGKNKTKLANSYYVLHFDFSGLDTRDTNGLELTFGAYIKEEIINFIEYYNLEEMEIDEYDHFANSLLSSKESFESATNKDGFIRSFYEVLKKHTNRVLDRIFITGVTSLTLDSLTSGFNICTNISNIGAMNGVMGFTFEEVSNLLDYIKISDRENIRIAKWKISLQDT